MSLDKIWVNRGSVFRPDGIKAEVVDPRAYMPGIRGWLERGFALTLQVRVTDEKSDLNGKSIRVGLGRISFGRTEDV